MNRGKGADGLTGRYKRPRPPATSYNGMARSLPGRQHLVEVQERDRQRLAGDRSPAGAGIDLVFQNPVLTTSLIARALDTSLQSALNLVRRPETEGIVTETRDIPGRSKRWVSTEVLVTVDPSATPTFTTKDDQ